MSRAAISKKRPPYAFVLDALSPLEPEVKRMFSGYAVYSGRVLLMMLRDSPKLPQDNGVWIVLSEGTDPADKSLRREFPAMRRIELLGGKIHHWLLLPTDHEQFETMAMRLCELLVRRDPRLGRVPESRRYSQA